MCSLRAHSTGAVQLAGRDDEDNKDVVALCLKRTLGGTADYGEVEQSGARLHAKSNVIEPKSTHRFDLWSEMEA